MPGKLFEKQVAKATGESGEVDLARLADLVTSAYEESDRDRRRTDRAIALMIGELETLNLDLERLVVDRTAELKQQNLRFDEALTNMSQGLTMFGPDGRLLVCNQRYLEIYRVPAERVVPGLTLRQLLEIRAEFGTLSGDLDEFLGEFLSKMSAGQSTSDTIELPDGRVIVRSNRPMANGGWVATHEDITERSQAEKRIAHMARHDALTDLPNRVLFRDELELAIARSARSGEHVAVLYLDLDHFKDVNDTLGHSLGDELLQAVANRLKQCVRASDTVSRLGGDEFAIIQCSVDQPRDAAALASRICEAIQRPFEISNHQVVVDVSVGIALAPGDGTEPEELLKNADLALYGAKGNGRGSHSFFEPGMDERLKRRRIIETDLRKALAAGEFELYYQPIFDLGSATICCCEALIRWRHPHRGIILPAEFIGVCEEIGLIGPIGEWVVKSACRQAAEWPRDVKVAVNLSALQFTGQQVENVVAASLASTGLAASRLEVEITEAALLRDTEAIGKTLGRLRESGVRVALDDFGTGYSSLSYLRSFTFDKIKIDRSFVADLEEKAPARAIVKAIAGLAASLNISSTAEGIETVTQLDLVRQLGCTEGQGYLFSVPRSAADISRLLGRPAAAGASAA